jgi:Mg2+ and Co2+ transporter CorA
MDKSKSNQLRQPSDQPYGFTMDQSEHEDIPWLNARVRTLFHNHVIKKNSFFHLVHHQLSDHAQGLSDIYDRICSTIRQFQEDNTELQNRVQELEQHDPSAELQRLREENASLRAKLAATAKARSEITRERDALLRKLNAVKQLVEGPSIPQV